MPINELIARGFGPFPSYTKQAEERQTNALRQRMLEQQMGMEQQKLGMEKEKLGMEKEKQTLVLKSLKELDARKPYENLMGVLEDVSKHSNLYTLDNIDQFKTLYEKNGLPANVFPDSKQILELSGGVPELANGVIRNLFMTAKEQIDMIKATKEKEENKDLSYHLEKEQIGNEKIQDYRVATDKQQNVVKREPIGKPYANTAGVAELRVKAFSSVPTSTPGVAYDKFNKKWLETDEQGNQKELSSEEVRKRKLTFIEETPTSDIKVMQQSVPSVLQLIGQARTALNDAGKTLGPAQSRWRELMSGKIGTADPNFRKLKTDFNLLQTRLMKMHVGARGGEYIMKHFQEIMDAAKDSPENLRVALDEIEVYAKEVGQSQINPSAGPTPTSTTNLIKFREGSDEWNIPSDRVEAFKKAHPRAMQAK